MIVKNASGKTSRPKLPGEPRMRRKNVNVDQDKLDRVVKLLGLRTETEAIDKALDLLLLHEEVMLGLNNLSGRGTEIENLFDEHLDL